MEKNCTSETPFVSLNSAASLLEPFGHGFIAGRTRATPSVLRAAKTKTSTTRPLDAFCCGLWVKRPGKLVKMFSLSL